jgi:hypothetical protein
MAGNFGGGSLVPGDASALVLKSRIPICFISCIIGVLDIFICNKLTKGTKNTNI